MLGASMNFYSLKQGLTRRGKENSKLVLVLSSPFLSGT